ncbi:MAG TPA: glycoside hydrolase family 15 protein [Polyangia bacterium]
MTKRIDDYAPIGDGRSVALVSRAGDVDWLCWPRFDSPSLFGALLDDRAGRWQLAPTTPGEARRAYAGDTNVLRTTFVTPTGRVVVEDFMTIGSEADKKRALVPDHEIVRIARCVEGEVELVQSFAPRPDYGKQPRLRDRGPFGLAVDTRAGTAIFRSTMPMARVDGGARGTQLLRAGDTIYSSLGFADDGPAVLPPLGLATECSLQRTLSWWQTWAARIGYHGPFGDAVRRSALALKLLIYSPSGAVISAPTTSLPERRGGRLNWDYRFCWLRDASLTMRALMALGFADEAQAFASWLLHSTRLTRPRLRILYDVYGNHPGAERELPGWRGFDGARPVHIGNAAVEQYQLDVYGELIDAIFQLARTGARFDRETDRMLRGFGDYVCKHWRERDEGIWEPRSGRAEHTHSRLLCWVAVDRLVALGERGAIRLGRAALATLHATRDEIRREIETRAWNDAQKSYVATLDGDDVDATLLLLAWYGFVDAADPRMRATYCRVRDELGAGSLLYRNHSGDAPGEGAFGICSFWGVEYLALGGGTVDEAERAFADIVACANDVGLFAEEIDPSSGAALGNFQQAFTHVGLVNAAFTIARHRGDVAASSPRQVQL